MGAENRAGIKIDPGNHVYRFIRMKQDLILTAPVSHPDFALRGGITVGELARQEDLEPTIREMRHADQDEVDAGILTVDAERHTVTVGGFSRELRVPKSKVAREKTFTLVEDNLPEAYQANGPKTPVIQH